jgi:hypothetical protein
MLAVAWRSPTNPAARYRQVLVDQPRETDPDRVAGDFEQSPLKNDCSWRLADA